jgi:hypothetical protein
VPRSESQLPALRASFLVHHLVESNHHRYKRNVLTDASSVLAIYLVRFVTLVNFLTFYLNKDHTATIKGQIDSKIYLLNHTWIQMSGQDEQRERKKGTYSQTSRLENPDFHFPFFPRWAFLCENGASVLSECFDNEVLRWVGFASRPVDSKEAPWGRFDRLLANKPFHIFSELYNQPR